MTAGPEFDRMIYRLMSAQVGRRDLLRRSAILGFGGAAFVGMLAACGDDDDDDDVDADTPVDEPDDDDDDPAVEPDPDDDDDEEDTIDEPDEDDDDEDEPDDEPVVGGLMRFGMAGEPETLDAMFASGVTEYSVNIQIQEGLYIQEELDQGEGVVNGPWLTETLEWSPDALSAEFHLHQGVEFHNGEPFTSESVKATYERTMDEELAVRNTWAGDINLEEVEIVDDYTFIFHFSEPAPHMLGRISKDHYMSPPQYLAEEDPTTVARHPIGTGPYIFQEWRAGDRIVVEANPNYWGDPKPQIQTIEFRWMPEHTTRLANLRTGEIDLMDNVLPGALEEIEAEDGIEAWIAEPSRRVQNMFNCAIEPTSDVRVRQAINYGANIEAICETILGGATDRMDNFINDPFKNPDVEGYHYDPDRAQELLSEAGYPDGISIIWDHSLPGTAIGSDEFPTALIASLAEVGIEVESNVMETAALNSAMADRTVNHMYFRNNAGFFEEALEWSILRPDPGGHPGNATQWEHEEFYELWHALVSGGSDEERLEWTYRMQEIFMEEAVFLFLWKEPQIYAHTTRLQNIVAPGNERVHLWKSHLSE